MCHEHCLRPSLCFYIQIRDSRKESTVGELTVTCDSAWGGCAKKRDEAHLEVFSNSTTATTSRTNRMVSLRSGEAEYCAMVSALAKKQSKYSKCSVCMYRYLHEAITRHEVWLRKAGRKRCCRRCDEPCNMTRAAQSALTALKIELTEPQQANVSINMVTAKTRQVQLVGGEEREEDARSAGRQSKY